VAFYQPLLPIWLTWLKSAQKKKKKKKKKVTIHIMQPEVSSSPCSSNVQFHDVGTESHAARNELKLHVLRKCVGV
jgi:hypothetical protein